MKIKKNKDMLAIFAVILLSLIIIVVSTKFINPKKIASPGTKVMNFEEAKVLEVSSEKITKDTIMPNVYIGQQKIKVEILTGKYAHQKFDIDNSMSRLYSIRAKVGMTVIVSFNINQNKVANISVYSYKRNTIVYLLIAIFFALLIFVGRMKGLKSVVSIVFSVIVLFYFMLPSIINGFSPVAAATISALFIIIVTLLNISGFNSKTYSAILGTISGVIIAGIVSYIVGCITHLTGLTVDYTETLVNIAQASKLNIKGLMYAVILISALGALMDIGISIASAIFEIHNVNPSLTKKELFKSGMNVGKDIIGTMSTTLILAFVGSSFTFLLLVATSNLSYIQTSNLDVVCTEIVQGLSGSIAIVITVPLTALISVLFIERSMTYKKQNDEAIVQSNEAVIQNDEAIEQNNEMKKVKPKKTSRKNRTRNKK